MEEFLLGEVDNLDKYILDIKNDFNNLSEEQIIKLEKLLKDISNSSIVTFKL